MFSIVTIARDQTTRVSPRSRDPGNEVEMWFHRRMLKISWVEKVTNDEVLDRVQKERQLLQRIEHGQNSSWGISSARKPQKISASTGKSPGRKLEVDKDYIF